MDPVRVVLAASLAVLGVAAAALWLVCARRIALWPREVQGRVANAAWALLALIVLSTML
ncbi:MAG: hypothetical protein WD749_11335 [Phycisphaerales bacterium]